LRIKGKWDTKEIWIDDMLVSPIRSQKVCNFSPDGFNWGYGGSGPAQLALGILLQATADDQEALLFNIDFTWGVVYEFPRKDFEIEIDVAKWLELQRARFLAS
jgi:hypothetical protein